MKMDETLKANSSTEGRFWRGFAPTKYSTYRGKWLWSALRSNEFIEAQGDRLGNIGILLRKTKGSFLIILNLVLSDFDPKMYRIITTFEPLYEIAASSSQEVILEMFDIFDAKISELKKEISNEAIKSIFPSIVKQIKALEEW